MSKFSKIFFIIMVLLMLILPTFAYATSIDMNLSNNLNTNNITNGLNQNLTNTSLQNTDNIMPSLNSRYILPI